MVLVTTIIMSHGVNSEVWKMHCNKFAKQLFPKFCNSFEEVIVDQEI